MTTDAKVRVAMTVNGRQVSAEELVLDRHFLRCAGGPDEQGKLPVVRRLENLALRVDERSITPACERDMLGDPHFEPIRPMPSEPCSARGALDQSPSGRPATG